MTISEKTRTSRDYKILVLTMKNLDFNKISIFDKNQLFLK